MTKNRYILLLNKSGIELYSDSLKKVYKIEFLPQSVYDLEVINETSLSQQISTVLETNKLLPGTILIVLTSSVLFQKDFQIAKDKKAIDDFVNNIPFENTCSITLPLSSTSERVIATNKDLYESIKNLFTKKGFTANGITLATLLGKNVSENTQALISLGMKKNESIKGDVFELKKDILDESEDSEASSIEPDLEVDSEKKKKITPRVVVLISVFGVLFLILAGLVIKTIFSPAPITQPVNTDLPDAIPNSSIVPTISQDSSSIQKLAEPVKFEIQTNQQNASSAARIREGLLKEGFLNITVTVNASPQTNQITFSNTLSPLVRNRVLDYISNELSEITERTVSEAPNDILLIIATK